MTLHRLVAATGGDLYAAGMRASIPGPGHSAADRSISLLLVEGRLVIHGFGGTDWRAAKAFLVDRGLIDRTGHLTDRDQAPQCRLLSGRATPRPDARTRRATACRLWQDAGPLYTGTAAHRYLRRRGLGSIPRPMNLRFHPRSPIAVYGGGHRSGLALVARISDDRDQLTAVELTYLEPNGSRATRLRLSRKTIGTVPAGAAVRLAPAGAELLVAEGVVTTLSAMRRFNLPGWALGAADNLAAWRPPFGVRRVLIAADSGEVGSRAAGRLKARLRGAGVPCRVLAPPLPFSDWNAADIGGWVGGGEEGVEGGTSGAPESRG